MGLETCRVSSPGCPAAIATVASADVDVVAAVFVVDLPVVASGRRRDVVIASGVMVVLALGVAVVV